MLTKPAETVNGPDKRRDFTGEGTVLQDRKCRILAAGGLSDIIYFRVSTEAQGGKALLGIGRLAHPHSGMTAASRQCRAPARSFQL